MASDSMEMSSDMGHRFAPDEDIDIDLDVNVEYVHELDYDVTIEDARFETSADMYMPGTSMVEATKDDVMEDDDGATQNLLNTAPIHDEELHDVSDLGQTDVDSTHIHETEQFNLPQETQPLDENQVAESFSFNAPPSEVQPNSHAANHDKEQRKELAQSVDTTDDINHGVAGELHGSGEFPAPKETEEHHQPQSNETTSESEHNIGANDETLSNLAHSVIVVYRGDEFSLFSSSEEDESETFFLNDTSVASQSIKDLMTALRGVLEDDIGDADELVIGFEDLRLDISEVS